MEESDEEIVGNFGEHCLGRGPIGGGKQHSTDWLESDFDIL